jgi:quercetin dioxygenase-like cupin family protein
VREAARAEGGAGRIDGVNGTDVIETMRAEGLEPREWSNGAGDSYGWHDHPYHKVLYCLEGDIVFHLESGDVDLAAGDRLDLPPGTRHAATVGPRGVHCVEAARD